MKPIIDFNNLTKEKQNKLKSVYNKLIKSLIPKY